MRYTALLAALFVAIGMAIPANAQNARQIAKRVFPSTVLLVMEDANGQPLSLGSGFFVTPDTVATNFHVIEGSKSGFAKLVGKRQTFEVVGVVSVDQQHDLALLKLKGVMAPSLKLAGGENVAVGDRVYAVGNPLGLEGTFTQGIVSGIRHSKTDAFLQISAPISPGSSGGPVLNSKGQVIGVATSTFKGGQNLNFAVPSTYVKAAIASMTPPRQLVGIRILPRVRKSGAGGGEKSVEAIKITHLDFSQYLSGIFRYSIRNRTRRPIKNVKILFVLKDKDNEPVDAVQKLFEGVIPPRLAKRTYTKANISSLGYVYVYKDAIKRWEYYMDIRILDYQFAR
jgi:S1-C subfamily serine protease